MYTDFVYSIDLYKLMLSLSAMPIAVSRVLCSIISSAENLILKKNVHLEGY